MSREDLLIKSDADVRVTPAAWKKKRILVEAPRGDDCDVVVACNVAVGNDVRAVRTDAGSGKGKTSRVCLVRARLRLKPRIRG